MNIWNLLKRILISITSAIALTVTSLWIGQQAYSWLPPQGAQSSILVDNLISFLVTLGAFIFLGVTGVVMYSLIFHRAAPGDNSDGPPIEGNLTLEVIWTVIPVMLVFWIAGYSYQVYQQMGIQGSGELMKLQVPGIESAYAATIDSPNQTLTNQTVTDIDVTAKQWAWVFHYPERNVTSTELHLPANQHVRLALQSEDVIHGFYIPGFRLKQDIIPNNTIDFEFTPVREGKYRLTDSQYSGTYFATMEANVIVESPEKYHKWLKMAAKTQPSPAKNQAALEYAQASESGFSNGWSTVIPAQPPVVNYSGGKEDKQ